MKLELNREWFEDRINSEDNCEIGAGGAASEPIAGAKIRLSQHPEDDFVEMYAFGALVELLRRDRMLSIEELAAKARVTAVELLNIENDPKYVPKPRTVHQLAEFFEIPQRSLLKLANVTTVHNDRLRDAAVRFAASSSQVMKLNREERVALTEFVEFLSSQHAD